MIEIFQLSKDKFERQKESLPTKEKSLIKEILKKKKYNAQKMYFKNFDDFLDSNLNAPYHLKNPQVAQMVMDAYQFYVGKQYDLWAICLMGNHIHVLFTVLPDSGVLWKIMQDIKKYTATQANKTLGLKGQFWERESYDHMVRDGEFFKILYYIMQNPVKAKFVNKAEDWKWTWIHPELKAHFASLPSIE